MRRLAHPESIPTEPTVTRGATPQSALTERRRNAAGSTSGFSRLTPEWSKWEEVTAGTVRTAPTPPEAFFSTAGLVPVQPAEEPLGKGLPVCP